MNHKVPARSKSDFTELISNEIEAVSKINDRRTYLDRLIYKHQLELTMLALKPKFTTLFCVKSCKTAHKALFNVIFYVYEKI